MQRSTLAFRPRRSALSPAPSARGGAAGVLVALLALAGLIAAIWWLAGRDEDPGGGIAREEQRAGDVPSASNPGALDAPGGDETRSERAGAARVEAAGASEEAAPGAAAADDVPRVAVSGTARLPEGTPSDERALVIAVAAPSDQRELADDPAPIERALAGESHPALLAIAPVADDGTWMLGVPEDRETVHLALIGRYVAPLRTTPVEVGADERPALEARLGAWVTVTFLAPDGVPASEVDLEGIEVQLGPDPTGEADIMAMQRSAVARDRRTDAKGVVSFHAVIEPGPKSLAWRHEALAGGVRFGVSTEPGRHVRVELPLAVGGGIAGRVEDEAGDPVPGATVGARLRGAARNLVGLLRETESAADGAFVLEHLPEGEYELTITHPEHRRATHLVEGELVGGGRLEVVVVLREGGRFHGVVVLPGGAPAPGAKVRATPDLAGELLGFGTDRDPGAEWTGRADDEGAFELRGLEEGAYYLEAEWTDAAGESRDEWSARRGGVEPGEERIVLELDELGGLRGVVRDAHGEPITDFHVRAELQGSGATFGIGAERESASVEDADDGAFTLDGLRPGTWSLHVGAEGFARSEELEVELPRPADAPPVEVVLPRPAVVLGTVVDSNGMPVDGARVALRLDIAAQVRAQVLERVDETFSDSDGAFRFELDPGDHVLVATHEGFAASEPAPVELAAGQRLEGVALRLRTGGTLTGVVRDDEGRPRADRSVIVQSIPPRAQPHILQTGRDGGFEKRHLEPGQWQIVVLSSVLEMTAEDRSAEGQKRMLEDMLIESARIVDGETTHVEFGGTATSPVEVAGVVAQAGEPIEGAVVSFIPEDSGGIGDLKMSSSDDDGRYSVRLPHGGAWLITVQNAVTAGRQNSIEFLERIPDGAATHTLDLELPGGRIGGKVRGPRGEPVPGCRITLNVEGGVAYGSLLGGHYTETVTDGDGRYDIPYLRAGTYAIAAGGPELGGMLGDDAPHGRTVKGSVELEDGEWMGDVDFRLEQPGRLTGVVRGPEGAPVTDAAIFLRDANGRMVERFSFVETDARGAFTYHGLAPGEYTAFARKGALVSPASDPTEIRSGAESAVEIELEEGCVLLVRVRDGTDADVRARVSVVDRQGREMTGALSMSEIMEHYGAGFSSKEQRVGPLPLGRYEVRAVADDGRDANRPVSVLRPGERSVNLVLD